MLQAPSLVVTNEAVVLFAYTGQPVGFDLRLRNAGPGTAYQATLADTLPANPGLSWRIDPAVPGCAISSGQLACTFARLDPGAEVALHLASPTTPETAGPVKNTVTAAAGNLPLGCTTCSASASTSVQASSGPAVAAGALQGQSCWAGLLRPQGVLMSPHMTLACRPRD